MNKAELAAYLASLRALIEAQGAVGDSTIPKWLADEYDRCWMELANQIRKEHDEARNRTDDQERSEEGADQSSGVTRRS